MTDFPKAITPEEFAKHFGWSPRKVRQIARDIGACRIVGNRMMLLQEDIDAILEASKPKPKAKPAYLQFAGPSVPHTSYDTLVAMRELDKKKKQQSKVAAQRVTNSTQAALDHLERLQRKRKGPK